MLMPSHSHIVSMEQTTARVRCRAEEHHRQQDALQLEYNRGPQGFDEKEPHHTEEIGGALGGAHQQAHPG